MSALLETSMPNLFLRGKVRDTYDRDDKLLIVATDRISAFDHVLPSGIPNKGAVLTQLSAFWFERTSHIVPNHLVELITPDLDAGNLRVSEEDLAKISWRSMLVKKAARIDLECIVRGYISGSAWAEYQKSGTVCDDPMQKGLVESEKFPQPIFTPSIKADTGHDENISVARMREIIGEDLSRKLIDISLKVYEFAHNYALSKGIIIADTKMEFGLLNGEIILIDELLTPDSSRFWDHASYVAGKSQPSFDKQFVRDWLSASGWDKEPPAPELPPDIVQKTAEKYIEAYRRLTETEVIRTD